MMKFIKRASLVLFALITTSSALIVLSPRSAKAFDPNNVASDSVFNSTGTMGAGDINNLLNKYSSSCLSMNNNFTTKDPLGFSSGAYQFGGQVSGGQAIYDIATHYDINPQIIVTTLQKEQSVVTGSAGCYPNTPDPSSARTSDCGSARTPCTDACTHAGGCMTIAMSYACPNDCYANIEGVSEQLSAGTWVLRWAQERSYGILTGYAGYDSGDETYGYSGPMTAGFRKTSSTDSGRTYDGTWTTSDGTSVNIANGATASLYTYTPFTSGNSSFDNLFTNTFGFGDPTTGMLTVVHPDGTLIRISNPGYPNVYETAQSGEAEFGTSAGVLLSNGYNLGNIKSATQNDITAMWNTDHDPGHTSTPSPMFYRCGTLVKGVSSPTVYVLDGCSSASVQKRSLVDQNNFNRLTYNFSSVITIPDSELSSITTGSNYDSSVTTHPNGSLVKPANSPTVYLLQPCSSGPACVNGQQAYNLTSIDYFLSYGFSFNQVEIATNSDLSILSSAGSNAITWFRAGTLVRANNSPTVYIIDESRNKRSFGNYYNFVGLGYNFNEVLVVPPSELPADGATINQY